MALGRDLGRAQDDLTLVLASTSPQRRAILEQLRIRFEVAAPDYVERELPGLSAAALVCAHAEGKARSVHTAGRITLGVDTAVVLDERVYGKPLDERDARRMLGELSGRTHVVCSGLCLLGPRFSVVDNASTVVGFRALTASAVTAYVESGEWQGRAGGYAIQGLGGRLVERIEGDYLNVVGLPGALLLDVLARYAPGLLEARSQMAGR